MGEGAGWNAVALGAALDEPAGLFEVGAVLLVCVGAGAGAGAGEEPPRVVNPPPLTPVVPRSDGRSTGADPPCDDIPGLEQALAQATRATAMTIRAARTSERASRMAAALRRDITLSSVSRRLVRARKRVRR